jgi:hypothetical protein
MVSNHTLFFCSQWLEAETWGSSTRCEVQVNGIPGSSWHGNLKVTEEGRALAAHLLSQLTDAQITDVFTAAKANLMRNDSVADWIEGFKSKMKKDVLDTKCYKQ